MIYYVKSSLEKKLNLREALSGYFDSNKFRKISALRVEQRVLTLVLELHQNTY